MAAMTSAERLILSRLALAHRLAAMRSRLVGTPLLRFQRGAPVADALLLVPRELRAADPSFAAELASGMVGLAGQAVDVTGRSVFDVLLSDPEWQRELHGFGWLRNLTAARDEAARRAAIELVAAWIKRHGTRRTQPVWQGGITGRRLLSWLYNADLLLDGAAASDYDRLLDSIGGHVVHLAQHWQAAPDGIARLTALAALAMAAVALDGHDRLSERVLPALGRELDRQVLADGGHISRHPGALIEPLLDLLSLTTCLRTRRLAVPPRIQAAIDRALAFLRFMRHGDGALARFNGMSVTPGDRLATAFSHVATGPAPLPLWAPQSRYARLAAGGAIVIADIGAPPPMVHAGAATAGCLSFELSADGEPVLVNCGMPTEASTGDVRLARATASHNTVVLAATSSARLVDDPAWVGLVGAAVLTGPANVTFVETTGGDEPALEASHDGYLARLGLLHTRRLTLSANGDRLSGEDRLAGRGKAVRLARDVPFAIHFHAAPGIRIEPGARPGTAMLTTRRGRRWTFEAEGAALSIEESDHLARRDNGAISTQIVLRGACFGESQVSWRLRRATAET